MNDDNDPVQVILIFRHNSYMTFNTSKLLVRDLVKLRLEYVKAEKMVEDLALKPFVWLSSDGLSFIELSDVVGIYARPINEGMSVQERAAKAMEENIALFKKGMKDYQQGDDWKQGYDDNGD